MTLTPEREQQIRRWRTKGHSYRNADGDALLAEIDRLRAEVKELTAGQQYSALALRGAREDRDVAIRRLKVAEADLDTATAERDRAFTDGLSVQQKALAKVRADLATAREALEQIGNDPVVVIGTARIIAREALDRIGEQ